MAYCQNCGTNLDTNPNYCPNCGAALNAVDTQQTNQQWSNTAKTVGTVAGAAVGATLLTGLLRRRRRHHMPPHGGHMGGPGGMGHGPMGGPGGHR